VHGLEESAGMRALVMELVEGRMLAERIAQAQMAGGTPRGQQKDVIAADYAQDGKTLAVVRRANRKVQLEYPAGKVICTTSGYLDYVRISPSGKEVAFLEHPGLNNDRGWVSVVDEAGNHKQLTKEYAGAQGLAWSRTGTEIWFTAAEHGADLQLYGVSLSGKQREILTTGQRNRLMDVAADGRVLLSNEQDRREITGIDPATGKERRRLEWFNGSFLSDILPDGKAILFTEGGSLAGPLDLAVYRKLDGSAPVKLGEGSWPAFSPDGRTAAAPVLTRPPQVALLPIGTGNPRQLPVGDIVSLTNVAWFPDGKHLLLIGAAQGQPLRTYEMDLAGGKPQPLGPPDFQGIAVAKDGKRIAGQSASAGWVVFDRETQKVQVIPGIAPQEYLDRWTEDGQAALVVSATHWEASIYRVEVATGKRTLLQTVKQSEKAGATSLGLVYAEVSKTYVYETFRILASLYLVEGLQ
jgi:Tol biopolymer transport system component